MRHFPFFSGVLCFTLCFTLSGCGLLESRKKPNIEEAPPYYQSGNYQSFHDEQRNDMAQQVHVFRNRELEKLEKTKDEEEERREEKGSVVSEKKEKKKWTLFSKDSKSFLRSEEASRISSNLDR